VPPAIDAADLLVVSVVGVSLTFVGCTASLPRAVTDAGEKR
jgi:hypothetical protein